MKEIIKGIFTILGMICIFLIIWNSVTYCINIESENIEYSGTITMKWKVDKLILDWYRFEIDNDTILDVDSEYTWYKYNKGDNYSWIEKESTYPNWWVLW